VLSTFSFKFNLRRYIKQKRNANAKSMKVGNDLHCSPRHRVPNDSVNEG
jgi:hypothetical protein